MKIQIIGTVYSHAENYARQLAADLDLPLYHEPFKFGGKIPKESKMYVAYHTPGQYKQYGTPTEDDKLIFIDKRNKWKQMLMFFAAELLIEKYNKKYNIKFEDVDEVEVTDELINQFDEEIDDFNFLVEKFSNINKIIFKEELNLRQYSSAYSLSYEPSNIEKVKFKNREKLKKYYLDKFRNSKPKKVLFIVQSEMTWACFRSLYHELKNRDDFEPLIIVIPQVYDTNKIEEKTWTWTTEHSEKVLKNENIPYYNLTTLYCPACRMEYLSSLNPEYVFIATKDDWYIKNFLGVNCKEISNKFKMIYVPYYGATIVDVELVHTQGKGHLNYWKIIVDSPLYADLFIQEDPSNISRLINVGHLKIEEIYKIRYSRGRWPLPNSDDKLKVIWAPHWSCPEFPDWSYLGERANRMKLGTFWKNCWDFYKYAKENQDSVQFVFRPHPLLQIHCKIHGYFEIFEEFMINWSKLPNVHNELAGLYDDTFAASDLMITEGISFLIEYPIATGKPLIMITNSESCDFNELGKLAIDYAQKANSFEEVKQLLESTYELNPNKNAEIMVDYLIPYRDQTSKKIIDTIELMFVENL